MTPPPAPPPSRTPSHLLPFVFGCVALFLGNLWAGAHRVMQADTSTSQAEHVGEMVGVFFSLVVAVGLVWGVTRFLERPPRFPVVTFFVLGILFLGQVGLAIEEYVKNSRFTPEERAGLVVTPDSISHPTLGFSVPNPQGAYSVSPTIQHRLDSVFADQEKIASWALNSANRGNIIIEATRFPQIDETGFRAYIREFRRKMTSLADTVLADSINWTTQGGEYVIEVHARAAFLRDRCLSRTGTDNLIVCVQAASRDSTGLAMVPAGFTLKE